MLTTLTLAFAPLLTGASTVITQLTGDGILDLALVLLLIAIIAAFFNRHEIGRITMQVVYWLILLAIVVFILSFIL